MKIVITGASGFVGTQLVPELKLLGHELVLVGRYPNKMADLFPDQKVCNYDQIISDAKNFDIIIHLAVLNNEAKGSKAEFFSTNVEFLKKIALIAKDAKIKKFVNVSTFHALDEHNQSLYAKSKRDGATAITKILDLDPVTIYLPLVWGRSWSGKLKFLEKFPRSLALVFFKVLAAFKPTIHIKTVADFFHKYEQKSNVGEFILYDDKGGNKFFIVTKRLIDILFAATVFILFGWAFILICIIIRLETRGSPVLIQKRVGKNGKGFFCYKFRTMRANTEEVGTHQVSEGSVTKIGYVLRKTKIDELPQILNIFLNQLSLVGPRPSLLSQKFLINERKKRKILSIKPGITGWAQIQNIDMSDPVLLAKTDAEYMAFRSILMDLKIMLRTASGRGQGDKTRF